jgi:signal transduction histidine kinase
VISGGSAATDAPRRPQSGHPALAWTLLIFSLSAYVAFALLFYTPISPATFYANGNNLAALWTVPIAAFSVIGWLIAVRKPVNPIGWICLAGGAVGGIASLADEIGSLLDQANSAAGHWVLLLSASTGNVAPSFSGLIVIALLLFPDGHLPSPRWRWVVGAIAAVSTFGFVLNLVDPTPGNIGESTHDVSALAIGGSAPTITKLGTFTSLATLALGATVVVSIFLRLRGADADRRHQIKWVAFASVLPVIVITGLSLLPLPSAGPGAVINAMAAGLTALAILAVPTAIGIAVLKYRLYDIDVIISRTLVYGALAALITAVYIGIAVGIGSLVGSGGQPNLWLSIVATIIVAAGFQPVRERLQRIANRLVYGKRATPYEVLSEFSGHVAETYAAEEVLPRMARVLQEGTGAESSTVWLRNGSLLRPAATFPDSPNRLEPVPMTDGGLPEVPGVTTSALVEHQGTVLGALSIVKRRGESLTPTEANLLNDLAHQAGLVLRNVSLTAELQQRLNELRASRQRLVHAQDEERRRLERNLHDGAQQHLVALKVKLGLALMLLSTKPDTAKATVIQLKADADEALATLRDLARGIYPPLLADKGLVVALESQARKATVPVTVEAEGVARYAQDVEATVYFCVLEALQNVQKYAGASSAAVRLRDDAGELTFEVIDDGAGFDAATVKKGAGLTNMMDRVDAIGGSVEVISQPGAGTRVRGDVPAPVREAALV